MKHIFCFALMLSFCSTSDAQVFSQDFSSSTTVSDYVGAPPSSSQVDGITTSGGGSTWSISSGTLQIVRTGNAGAFTRSTDFSPTPSSLLVKFDLNVPAATANQTTAATLTFGSGYTSNNSAETGTNVHTRIGINLISGGGFQLRDVGAGSNSATFTSTQSISLYINNGTAGTNSYTGPNGNPQTVGLDKTDVWVGTTLVFDEMSAQTATQILTDFKFVMSAGTGTIQFDNFDMQSDILLPVSLTHFNALKYGVISQLSWQTASEANNSHFDIERSANGQQFEKIGQVKGSGHSTSIKEYNYTDEKPLRGANYYRLRQVDYDGQFAYSPVVTVWFGPTRSLSLAPSPSVDRVTISLPEAFETEANWQVFDLNGRLVQSGIWQPETTSFDLNVSALTQGLYSFRLVAGQEVLVKQFRKL